MCMQYWKSSQMEHGMYIEGVSGLERVTQAEIPLFPAIGKELFHTIRKTFLRRNQQIDFQYFFLQELVYIFFVFPLFKSYKTVYGGNQSFPL